MKGRTGDQPMTDFTTFMTARQAAAGDYVRGRAAAVDALTSDRAPVTFFGPDGKSVSGADAVTKAFDSGARHFDPGGDSRLEILQSADGGDIGYWCGLQHAHVEMDGKTVPMTLRITELFRREDGEWKLVHRHADMMKG